MNPTLHSGSYAPQFQLPNWSNSSSFAGTVAISDPMPQGAPADHMPRRLPSMTAMVPESFYAHRPSTSGSSLPAPPSTANAPRRRQSSARNSLSLPRLSAHKRAGSTNTRAAPARSGRKHGGSKSGHDGPVNVFGQPVVPLNLPKDIPLPLPCSLNELTCKQTKNLIKKLYNSRRSSRGRVSEYGVRIHCRRTPDDPKDRMYYLCLVCGRSETTTGHMPRHHDIFHSNNFRYQCRLPNCLHAFKRTDNRLQHERHQHNLDFRDELDMNSPAVLKAKNDHLANMLRKEAQALAGDKRRSSKLSAASSSRRPTDLGEDAINALPHVDRVQYIVGMDNLVHGEEIEVSTRSAITASYLLNSQSMVAQVQVGSSHHNDDEPDMLASDSDSEDEYQTYMAARAASADLPSPTPTSSAHSPAGYFSTRPHDACDSASGANGASSSSSSSRRHRHDRCGSTESHQSRLSESAFSSVSASSVSSAADAWSPVQRDAGNYTTTAAVTATAGPRTRTRDGVFSRAEALPEFEFPARGGAFEQYTYTYNGR